MARFQPAEAFRSPDDTLELLPLRFTRAGRNYLVSNMVGDFVRLSGDEMNRLVDLRVKPGDGLYEKAYTAHLITGAKSKIPTTTVGDAATQSDGISSPTHSATYFCCDSALRTFLSLLSGFAAKH